MIEAYNALAEKGAAIIPLVIVGDAPYATEYKERLKSTACSQVVFTGFQFGEAYEELQSNCRLYVQATEVGGTHPALIESMSYGNCVVVNGTPENLEVIGDAASSFPKNDFTALSAIMLELLRDPKQCAELGERAKARALANYSWDAVVSKYEALFTSLITKKQERP